MIQVKRSIASLLLVSFAAIGLSGAALLTPEPASADTALFRVLWYWYWKGGTWGGTAAYIEPPTMGSAKRPPAAGYVGTTTIAGQPAQRFTVPKATLRDFTPITGYVKPGTCYKGYPISGGVYSSQNQQGRLGPNNPYAATMTTVLRFPTTMSSTAKAYGAGDPRTPTTTFPYFRWNNYTTTGPGTQPTPSATYRERGNYDFNRAGSVQIIPGPHRFGGTLRYIYSESGFWYQYITRNSPWISTVYATGTPQWQRTGYDEAEVGEKVSGGYAYRFRWTPNKQYQATNGSPYFSTINWKNQYLDTAMPWTTGDLVVWQPLGTYVTTLTYGGYDNRTSMGGSGTISLVRGRLRHSFLKPSDPREPITDIWHAGRLDRIDVMFSPEPGAVLLLGAGVVTLAGLVVARRRR
jgi:hypothetical protein